MTTDEKKELAVYRLQASMRCIEEGRIDEAIRWASDARESLYDVKRDLDDKRIKEAIKNGAG